MMNTRYTFYRVSTTLQHNYFHSLTKQQCSRGSAPEPEPPEPPWGLCSQTLTLSRFVLGFLSVDFQNNNICCKTLHNLLIAYLQNDSNDNVIYAYECR